LFSWFDMISCINSRQKCSTLKFFNVGPMADVVADFQASLPVDSCLTCLTMFLFTWLIFHSFFHRNILKNKKATGYADRETKIFRRA
jgi:hypothetical protein